MPGKPYIPFYVGDWRKDPCVQSLTLEEKGAWIELMCFMHESAERGQLAVNGAPLSPLQISSLLGISVEKTEDILSKLIASGTASYEPTTNIMYCRRMVREAGISQMRSEVGHIGGIESGKQRRSKKEASNQQITDIDSESDNDIEDDTATASETDVSVDVYKKSSNPEPPNANEDIWQIGYWDLYTERGVDVGIEIFKILQWAKSKDVRRNNWKATITNWLNKSVAEAIPPDQKSAHVPPEFTPAREVSDGERKEQVQAIGDLIKERWPDKEVDSE